MPKDRAHSDLPNGMLSADKVDAVQAPCATPIVIYYVAPGRGTDPAQGRRIEEIKNLGFQVDTCVDAAELLRTAQYCKDEEIKAIFVLTGSVIEICSVAMNLRAHQIQHAVVALMDSNSDMALTQVLQSGVDNYCVATSQVGLLAAILLRLQSRFYRESMFGQDENAEPRWRLAEQDWVLVSPEGVRIRLTTNERCFMKILLSSPELRVTHEQLLAAMGPGRACAGSEPAPRQSRLGVMISRLRMKFTEHGVPCPLKSLHNWGYMFTGTV